LIFPLETFSTIANISLVKAQFFAISLMDLDQKICGGKIVNAKSAINLLRIWESLPKSIL